MAQDDKSRSFYPASAKEHKAGLVNAAKRAQRDARQDQKGRAQHRREVSRFLAWALLPFVLVVALVAARHVWPEVFAHAWALLTLR